MGNRQTKPRQPTSQDQQQEEQQQQQRPQGEVHDSMSPAPQTNHFPSPPTKRSHRKKRSRHEKSLSEQAKALGFFQCKSCGHPLYPATLVARDRLQDPVWPALEKLFSDAVKVVKEIKYGTMRNNILCKGCGESLGHVSEGTSEYGADLKFCSQCRNVQYVAPSNPQGYTLDHLEDPRKNITSKLSFRIKPRVKD